MLVVAHDKKVEDFKKYGFKVLVTDEELEKRMETDPVELYCTMAYIPLGNHFNLIIENDEFCKQLTIVPDDSMTLKFCLSWELDLIYRLQKDGMIECLQD